MTFAMVGLLLGTMVAAPVPGMEHSVRIDHRTGTVESQYSADVRITHKQVGTVGVGGRPSTLRCVWSAGLVVDRQARHASGSTMARAFAHDDVVQGSRPGWCSAQRSAIATEVAARQPELRERLIQLATDDHGVLHAEIDRMDGTTQVG